MRRIAVALAFAISVLAFAAGSAGSATSRSAFRLFVERQIPDPGGQTPPRDEQGGKANARGVNFNKHNLFVMLG